MKTLDVKRFLYADGMARERHDDAVDRFVAQWAHERPDLDLAPMAVIGRLGRLSALGTAVIEAGLARHGLKLGEFDVLASLRRAGQPYELTPGALIRQLMLSSGAMTNRLDRLEENGLVQRAPDPADRRGVIVRLTPEGHKVVDEAVTDHVATEAGLLQPLSASERATLDRLLRKLLGPLDPH
jgi:DNA-binding MarR family transcriptional regulator